MLEVMMQQFQRKRERERERREIKHIFFPFGIYFDFYILCHFTASAEYHGYITSYIWALPWLVAILKYK